MVELSFTAESDFSLHDARVPRRQPSTCLQALVRGTQRIVSVNYLFGRPCLVGENQNVNAAPRPSKPKDYHRINTFYASLDKVLAEIEIQ